VFSMFLSSRAVPATPGERLGASAEFFPDACGLRVIFRRSASPSELTRLHLGSLRATAREFAAAGLPATTACWSRFCWTPHGITQGTALPYYSAIHRGGLLSSH
jgi:hypothetical protein